MHQKAFAGQTFDRTVHKGDLTGIEIINRLAEQVWARGIARLEEHRAVELIKTADGGALAGVLMIDMRTGEFVFVQAKAVLLATGGGPTMYKYHTPSGDKSCDGLAMALRAGLTLRDMEMVQFHPTGLLAGAGTRMTGTVLEEGLRGAGGYLLNGDQQRFMIALRRAQLSAPRATSSRARSSPRCATGRTSPNGGVYIQMAHLGPEKVREQFKGMVERCADCGFDLAGGLVEVVPTAHYMMGGVVFRADCTHGAAGPVRGRRGHRRRARRQPAGRQRRRQLAPCSAASPATAWRPGCRATARCASRTRPTLAAAAAAHVARLQQSSGRADSWTRSARRCSSACGTTSASCARRRACSVRWPRLTGSTRQLARTGVADVDRAFNLSWHDWLNLKNLIAVSRVIATLSAGARGLARRALP